MALTFAELESVTQDYFMADKITILYVVSRLGEDCAHVWYYEGDYETDRDLEVYWMDDPKCHEVARNINSSEARRIVEALKLAFRHSPPLEVMEDTECDD